MFSDKKRQKNDKNASAKLAEAMFLDYVSCFGNKRKVLMQPAYFRDELGIDDMKSYEKKMAKEGYVMRNPDGYLELTEKGQRIMLEYEDYIRFFELAIPYINISEYEEIKRNSDEDTVFEKIIISLLNKKTEQSLSGGKFQDAANLYYEMGKLYVAVCRSDEAMACYLNALYIQVSGYEYAGVFRRRRQGKITSRAAEALYTGMYIDPHLMRSIEEIGYAYWENMVDDIYKKARPKAFICKKKDFKLLVSDTVCGMIDFEKWWGHFHARYNELVKGA